MKRTPIPALAMAAALAVAGCSSPGNDDASSAGYTPSPDPTPSAEQLEAINAKCLAAVHTQESNAIGTKYEHVVSSFTFDSPKYGELLGHPPVAIYDVVMHYTTTPAGSSTYAHTPRPYIETCRFRIGDGSVELRGGREG